MLLADRAHRRGAHSGGLRADPRGHRVFAVALAKVRSRAGSRDVGAWPVTYENVQAPCHSEVREPGLAFASYTPPRLAPPRCVFAADAEETWTVGPRGTLSPNRVTWCSAIFARSMRSRRRGLLAEDDLKAHRAGPAHVHPSCAWAEPPWRKTAGQLPVLVSGTMG